MVVATPRNVGLLREALGVRAGQVEVVDSETWYRAPMRTVAADRSYVEEHRGRGRVRVIGETPWPLDRPAKVRDWTRYHSVVNAALATSPVWMVCLFDTRVLPEPILADAERTHTQLVSGGTSRSSETYVEPGDFCRALDEAEPLSPPPGNAADLSIFSGTDLTAARRFVAAAVSGSGMSRERVSQAVLAADEVVTNAIRHGGGRGNLRCWTESGELIVRIEDRGEGISDPLAGCIPPGFTQADGFGLWLARQMADRVQIRSGTPGATVQLCFDVV
jgi:anti-sigma regulatory factor (Ser/Thr protein kinase)